MGVEKLESQAGILRIVLVLQRGELTLSELMNAAGINQTAAYNSVKKLLDLGWIEEKKEREFPFKRTFKLTVQGKEAGKSVKKLDAMC